MIHAFCFGSQEAIYFPTFHTNFDNSSDVVMALL